MDWHYLKTLPRRLWLWLAAVALLLLVFLAAADWANPRLEYSREAILHGQWWRLLSAHLVHTNLWHGLMNLAALGVILLLVGPLFRLWQWLFSAACAGLAISLTLLFMQPQLQAYVGLSGVLHALLAQGLVVGVLRYRDGLHAVALVLLVIKIGREQWPGFDVMHLSPVIEAPVVVDAHLYGALAGIILGVLYVFSPCVPPVNKNGATT